jgi:hypothetical protein
MLTLPNSGMYSLNICVQDINEKDATTHTLQVCLIIITAVVFKWFYVLTCNHLTRHSKYDWRILWWFKEVHLCVLSYIHITDGYRVLLVILELLIWNHHLDMLRRNSSKTELPEGGISRWRNMSESKLLYDLRNTV